MRRAWRCEWPGGVYVARRYIGMQSRVLVTIAGTMDGGGLTVYPGGVGVSLLAVFFLVPLCWIAARLI